MDLNKKNNMPILFTFSFTLIYIFLLSNPSSAAASNVKAGYWFQDSGLPLSSINATLFTHLFAAFADLDSTTFQLSLSPSNANSFSQFTSTLQQTNPSLITLLSIGGGNSTPATFASMASSPSTRKTFIDSAITTARSHSFLGLDLDYEYPPTQSDMSNLGTLFSEWRAAITAESSSSGLPPLLLTAAVSYSNIHDSIPYPAASIAANLDWLNLMAYDFWFYAPAWSRVTRPSAALRDDATGVSGSSGVAAWVAAGVPANKLVLGIPFYGHGWTLADANNHGYLAPATGPAVTEAPGAVTYAGIKAFLAKNDGVTTVYNSTVVESYSYVGTTWIAYDDVEAVAAKVDFVKEQEMLGYFIWHIAQDDNFVLATTAYNSL